MTGHIAHLIQIRNKNKRAYECVLSIILEEPDVKMEEVKVEQVILNRYGKRAIRLDAWGKTTDDRQVNMEMENHSGNDNVAKRSRYYQGLHLDDGTTKIFLNMSSKNGSKELVSMLQYMKNTKLDNPEIKVRDERIVELDKIVSEVKESEEWEAVQMNILEVGISRGMEQGIKQGIEQGVSQGETRKLVSLVCKKLEKGCSVEEIADMLEEETEVIQTICDTAKQYAPDYDVEKICKELN